MGSAQEEMEDTLKDRQRDERKGEWRFIQTIPFVYISVITEYNSNDSTCATCVSYPGLKPGNSANINIFIDTDT